MISEVSTRYAQAFYEVSKESNNSEKMFSELRAVEEVMQKETEIAEFFSSPIVSFDHKIEVIQKALATKFSAELINLLCVLASNNRLANLSEITKNFETIVDEDHGVTRGKVTSAFVLDLAERKKIEETIQKLIGKKVILNFEEDKSLLGGMVAQVGGWTFDDSLRSHLTRLKEDLNRRT